MTGENGQPTADASSRVMPSRRTLIGAGAAAALLGHRLTGARVATARSPAGAPRGAAKPSRAAQADPAGRDRAQAVVSAHEAATEAGLAMLGQGGTAADAAVAVAAVLSVVEGWFSSLLGGGTWGLYFDAAAGEVTSLDGVGPVGAKATREDYAARAGDDGIHQSIVPGAWDGWMLWLDRYGHLDLGDVLAPATRLCRDGHAASAELAEWAGNLEEELLANPAAARIYAPDGDIPAAGDVIVIDDLANTFDALVSAYNGALAESRPAAIQAARDYFYRGPLAEAIVAFSDENGGYLTLDDFATFEAEIVPPVSILYRDGISVYQNPPNSQGVTMLLALNILKELGLSRYDIDDADAVHLQIEAVKLAFADRHAHIGDPARIDIPLEELLSDEHAARQRERIDLDGVLEWPFESGVARLNLPAHTSTFQIVDREGNAASVTTSLGAQFLVVGDTGIHINNRMRFLSVEEGNANELTPGYKVRHTSCPYLSVRNGRPYILGGNTGVDTQPQGQLQQFVSVAEFGLGAQAAIDRPRWVSSAFPATNHPWEVGNTLNMQEGFPPALRSALEAKGHDIEVGEGIFGAAGMLIVTDDGADVDLGVEPNVSTASGAVIPAVT